MPNATILFFICAYLALTPVVTSVNGLSLIVLDISAIGPLYHALFSASLLAIGLGSPVVRKSWGLIAAAFGVFGCLIATQLAAGYSGVGDLGILYKWFMPLLLFAVYFRWDYLGTPAAQRQMIGLFQQLPMVYAALILVSAGAYLLTGFQATMFEAGTLRFSGFTFAYNPTVNAMFLCGYIAYVVAPVGALRTIVYCAAFLLLRSKTAIVYLAMALLAPLRRLMPRARLFGVLRGLIAAPLVFLVLTLGVYQTYQAADPTGQTTERGLDLAWFGRKLVENRVDWLIFTATDLPQWPAANLLVGNGMNIDRRFVNPTWWAIIGQKHYMNRPLSRTDKNPELDLLGPLDLFGVIGLACFLVAFYVYPFRVIRLPFFRPFYAFMLFVSVFSGHLINNPQTTPLLVFFILTLRARTNSFDGGGPSGMLAGLVA